MIKIMVLLSLFFALPSWGQVLPEFFKASEGRTFNALGPNCFATALKLNGITRSFRGLDAKEFQEITKLFCHKVQNPQIGDIGVFETPGFGFLHAYAYISDELAMQKPGVDYNGKTPIAFYSLYSVNFMYLASAECRRYAPDPSVCSNLHYQLRCEPIHMMGNRSAEQHDEIIQSIELRLDALLDAAHYGATEKNIYLETQNLMTRADLELANVDDIPAALKPFLLARMESLKDQMKFIAQKFSK